MGFSYDLVGSFLFAFIRLMLLKVSIFVLLIVFQVLSYGRNRKVILEAPLHDKDCVLGNILAAHYLSSSDHHRAKSYLEAATSNLVSLCCTSDSTCGLEV